uniref:Putative E3 ubiquitin-protein ligase RBBP6-like isoform X1 n=1 Tax=Davidia involucrata TaxID=16924 RepID=A0A5B6YIH5_DAVIN
MESSRRLGMCCLLKLIMAGLIEKPSCLEAHSIHSGSISFGRFENEPLFWERRSSFLHNSHLEEVERYSKPGSVNQKKEYFEVFFRKKVLLQQPSSQWQSWVESQTSEKDAPNHMSCVEKPDLAVNSHPAYRDESPNHHGENEVMGSGSDDEKISSGGVQVEPNLTIADTRLKDNIQHAEAGGVYESQVGRITPLIEDGIEVDVEHKYFDEAENVVGLPGSTKLPAECHTARKVNNPSLKKSQEKSLKAKAEMGTSNPKMQTSVTLGQSRKKNSSEASKHVARHPIRLEKENSPPSKTEKQSLQKIPTVTSSQPRTLNLKDHEDLKVRQKHQLISQNVKQTRKTGTSLPTSVLKKGESRICQSTNRPKPTLNSTEKTVKPSLATINLKSNGKERKEKEEEKEAGIKQLRKSLDLETTLTPSFCHKNVLKGSGGKKAVAHSVESTKLKCKSSSPVSRTVGATTQTQPIASLARCSTSSTIGQHNPQSLKRSEALRNDGKELDTNGHDLCPFQAVSTKLQCKSSSPTSRTAGATTQTQLVKSIDDRCSSTIRHHTPQAEKRSEALKKNREKGRDAIFQKQGGSKSNEAKKVETKNRSMIGRLGRSSGEMVRKVMQGGVGGILAVRVQVA